MIVRVDGFPLEVPAGMNPFAWSRTYFEGSNTRGLFGHYQRLEDRYARMGMGKTSLDYRHLKDQTSKKDEESIFEMGMKLVFPLLCLYHSLYKRYRGMGLYHTSNLYRELAKKVRRDMIRAVREYRRRAGVEDWEEQLPLDYGLGNWNELLV